MRWITCENTYEESWRRILEYANIELAVEAIEEIHGKPLNGNYNNYKKQAEQIRVSLLQAKEYFKAVINSTLFTKPNHLYYGSVALSIACMLLRGDGTKSLDYLRKNKKNSHHGLEFSFSLNMDQAKNGFNLLENSYVKIAKNGHFPNWYSTLTKVQPVGTLVEMINNFSVRSNFSRYAQYEISPIQDLIGKKETLLNIIERLPDMSAELIRYGFKTRTARGSHKISVKGNQQENIYTFHDSLSYDILMNIVKKFKCKDGVYFSVSIEYGKTSGVIRTRKDKNWMCSFPDSRETINQETIFYEDEIDTPEIVDVFKICYGLSMLSRYYPDIWVGFLESHCKGSKLIEGLITILTSKIPILVLNQMTGTQYTISTQRPYWHQG